MKKTFLILLTGSLKHLKVAIDIDKLCFSYEKNDILKDISLRVNPGEFHLIIGPNGGGKTTLLKLILGLLKPRNGSILLNDKPPIGNISIGYLPQSYNLDKSFPISVEEFVMLGVMSKLSWHGRWSKDLQNKCKRLLSSLGVDKLNAHVVSLSGGEFQRISLARALIDDPEMLVLDEPTSGLDKASIGLIKGKLSEMKGKSTILMVSHSIEDFLDDVDAITCINQTAEKVDKNVVCSHYKMGVYH